MQLSPLAREFIPLARDRPRVKWVHRSVPLPCETMPDLNMYDAVRGPENEHLLAMKSRFGCDISITHAPFGADALRPVCCGQEGRGRQYVVYVRGKVKANVEDTVRMIESGSRACIAFAAQKSVAQPKPTPRLWSPAVIAMDAALRAEDLRIAAIAQAALVIAVAPPARINPCKSCGRASKRLSPLARFCNRCGALLEA